MTALLPAALLLTVLLVAGCVTAESQAEGDEAPLLRVSAASSLRQVLPELARLFRMRTGADIVLNTGASGVLAKQVEGGAPVDVIALAALAPMEDLAAAGHLADESLTRFAANRIVLVTPPGAPGPAAGDPFQWLTSPPVKRVVTGNPVSAPHGAASLEVLEHAGVVEAVRPKLILTENAAQTRDYLVRGEVDAGLVFASEAQEDKRLGVLVEAPADAHSPVVYAAAVTATAARPDLARAFLEVLASAEGQAILERHGFLPAVEAGG